MHLLVSRLLLIRMISLSNGFLVYLPHSVTLLHPKKSSRRTGTSSALLNAVSPVCNSEPSPWQGLSELWVNEQMRKMERMLTRWWPWLSRRGEHLWLFYLMLFCIIYFLPNNRLFLKFTWQAMLNAKWSPGSRCCVAMLCKVIQSALPTFVLQEALGHPLQVGKSKANTSQKRDDWTRLFNRHDLVMHLISRVWDISSKLAQDTVPGRETVRERNENRNECNNNIF